METKKSKKFDRHSDQSIKIASATNVRDASHLGNRDINYGTIIKQNNTGNSVTYEIDKEDNAFTEKASIFIVNKFGEKKIGIIGLFSLIASIFTILTGLVTFLSTENNFFAWFAFLSKELDILIIVLGFAWLVLAIFLINIVQYKKDSQCKKCNRFYALEEIGAPQAREVKVQGGVRRTIARQFKCRFCDETYAKKKNDFVEDTPRVQT